MDELAYYAVGIVAVIAAALGAWYDSRRRDTDERRDAHAAHQQIAAIREHLAAMPTFDHAAYAVLEHRVETLEQAGDNGDQLRALNDRIAEVVGILSTLENRVSAVEKKPRARKGK